MRSKVDKYYLTYGIVVRICIYDFLIMLNDSLWYYQEGLAADADN